MMSRGDLPSSVLERRAIVYVRQSTLIQVEENLESQRRQYELADQARELGFRDILVIDDDLGVSASGTSAQPGFESLVAQICEGIVGGVFCLEASRLARNGCDWHHLLELCGLVGARVFDVDGVYDPSLPNDRLLLGLKRTMSEFELTVMRRRLLDAALAKARRGELRFGVPVGLVWPPGGKIEPELFPSMVMGHPVMTFRKGFSYPQSLPGPTAPHSSCASASRSMSQSAFTLNRIFPLRFDLTERSIACLN